MRERKCEARVWRERVCVDEEVGVFGKRERGRVCEKREIGGECGER